MKKAFKIIGIGALVLFFGGWAFLSWNAEDGRAVPGPEALKLMQSDGVVDVSWNDDWLVMKPVAGEPTVGVILYSGAYCDIVGYTPIIREVAAEGYLVVAPQMPFYFSIFSPNEADTVRAAYPDIDKWVIVGHSMGGAMAGRYADIHRDDLAGIVFLDAYPPDGNSLADADLPVMHIHRATLEGEPPQMFIDKESLYPEDAIWVPAPGGLHMYFGDFIGGAYNEEWEAQIPAAAQWAITRKAIIEFLKGI